VDCGGEGLAYLKNPPMLQICKFFSDPKFERQISLKTLKLFLKIF
jgi:hypothetical protein